MQIFNIQVNLKFDFWQPTPCFQLLRSMASTFLSFSCMSYPCRCSWGQNPRKCYPWSWLEYWNFSRVTLQYSLNHNWWIFFEFHASRTHAFRSQRSFFLLIITHCFQWGGQNWKKNQFDVFSNPMYIRFQFTRFWIHKPPSLIFD